MAGSMICLVRPAPEDVWGFRLKVLVADHRGYAGAVEVGRRLTGN